MAGLRPAAWLLWILCPNLCPAPAWDLCLRPDPSELVYKVEVTDIFGPPRAESPKRRDWVVLQMDENALFLDINGHPIWTFTQLADFLQRCNAKGVIDVIVQVDSRKGVPIFQMLRAGIVVQAASGWGPKGTLRFILDPYR